MTSYLVKIKPKKCQKTKVKPKLNICQQDSYQIVDQQSYGK